MYHSVTFGDRNTFDNWHLVPDGRPSIIMPEPKIVTVDIPGRDGVLDLSEALRKFPVYNNRKGSLTFHVLNGYGDWQVLYSSIANYLHGRTLKVVLEDDPRWYYTGRAWVKEWISNNDGTWSDIVIDYDLEPYKLYDQTSLTDNWLWDTFSFVNGRIIGTQLKDIRITSTTYTRINLLGYVGTMPLCPKFIINSSGGVDVHVYNEELGLNVTKQEVKTGVYTWPEVFFSERKSNNVMYLDYKNSQSGYTSSLSVEYRMGSL